MGTRYDGRTRVGGLSRLDTNLLLRGVDEKTGEFEGWAAVFNLPDDYETIFRRGCFENALAKHRQNGTVPAMLWQHQWTDVCGRWLLIEERFGGPTGTGGLFVRGQLELKTQVGAEALALLAAKPRPALEGLSIGFLPVQTERDVSGLLAFTEVDLWEVSLVTFPSQSVARVERSADCGLEPAKRELRSLISDFKGAF